MLQLIFGCAGSGKTAHTYSLAAEHAKLGKEVILIVPEQFSFESERAMLRLLGDSDARHVKVFSFTRLAWQLAGELGTSARKLDDSSRAAVMGVVLSQLGDRLTYYSSKRSALHFIPHLIDAVKEFKVCAVSPDMLEQASRNVRGTLSSKLSELALVYRTYDAVCAQTALDPLSDLDILADRLDTSDFFKGTHVIIDSFRSFTGQEHKIIRKIIGQSEYCAVTLCTDGSTQDEYSLFSTVNKTAARLMQAARDNGVKIAPHVRLEPGKRFTSPALAAVERGIYRYDDDVACSQDTDDVCIYAAANRCDEVEYCARECRRLLREEGYRCREIAVIARSSEKYAELISDAFEQQDIDCFIDLRTPVENSALMRFVSCALNVVSGSWQLEDIMKMLKCSMISSITWDDICAIENYCLIWNIRGRSFKTPFTANPAGFTGALSEYDKQSLDRINLTRSKVYDALSAFEARLRSGIGRDMAAAVFELLCDCGTQQAVSSIGSRVGKALCDDGIRIWNILIGLLDQIAAILGTSKISVRDFAQLFSLMIRSSNLGHIPQRLDEVTFGSADRVRLSQLRAVFIIGVLDGEFPGAPSGTAVFSDDERRLLCSMGVPITEPSEQQLLDERMLAYSAVCSASEKLYITYPAGSYNPADKYTPETPGLVSEVLRCVPNARYLSYDSTNIAGLVEGPAAAFETYARTCRTDNEYTASLRRVLSSDENYSGRIQLIDASDGVFRENVAPGALCSVEHPLHLSASRIDSYYRCRFEYFCKYCLRLSPRRKAEIDSLQYGSAIHYVLERLLSENGKDAFISAAQTENLEKIVSELLAQYLREQLGDTSEKDGRFRFMWNALSRTVCAAVRNIAGELAGSDFVPVAFELKLGSDGDVVPAEIIAPDGTKIIIDGYVDRVDVFTDGDKKYLRVIDYKSGKKSFRLSEVLDGLNVQMLMYLNHLCSPGSRFSGYTPAGVMYCPTGSSPLNMHRDAGADEIAAVSDKSRRRSGVVIDDSDDYAIVSAMEHDASGVYIPVRISTDKSGKAKIDYHTRNNLISTGQFNIISSFISKIMTDMCTSLAEGIIAPLPAARSSWNACQNCDYSSICRYEGEQKLLGSADTEQVVEEMAKRLNGGDNNA